MAWAAPFLTVGGIAILYQGIKTKDWLERQLDKSERSFWSASFTGSSDQGLTNEAPTTEQQVDELQYQSELAQVLRPLDLAVEQIRLLRIQANEDPSAPVVCSLEHANLGDNPSYVALSYRWGSARQRRVILIDGIHVLITQNLHEALLKMRQENVLLVWTDALCIDQRNQLEQHNQFRKMTLIYTHATSVFAWLGQSTALTKWLKDSLDDLRQYREQVRAKHGCPYEAAALQDLYKLWSAQVSHVKRIRSVRVVDSVLPSVANFIRYNVEGITVNESNLQRVHADFLEALQGVLGNEYWRRAWILQELAVAGQIRLHFDDHELDWDIFAEVVEELYLLHEGGEFPPLTPNHRHVVNIVQLRPQLRRSKMSLLTVLRKSYATLATREYDKVYSILGLCEDASKFVVETEKLDMWTLQLKMTQNVIRGWKVLDIICLKKRQDNADITMALPSWVPELVTVEGDPFAHRMLDYLTGLDKHIRIIPGFKSWHATNDDLYLPIRLRGDTQVLNVTVMQIGTITDLSGAIEGQSISQESHLCAEPHSPTLRRIRSFVWTNDDEVGLKSQIYDTITTYKEFNGLDDEILDFSHLWSSRSLTQVFKADPITYQWLSAHKEFRIHGWPLCMWSVGRKKRLSPKRVPAKALRAMRHLVEDDKPSENQPFTTITSQFNKRNDAITESITTSIKEGLRLMGGSRARQCQSSTTVLEDFLGRMGVTPDEDTRARHRFTGWAHPAAQINDGVYLIQGCSMPVILRPVENSEFAPAFRVIGDAYVAGAMDGELWRQRPQPLYEVNLV